MHYEAAPSTSRQTPLRKSRRFTRQVQTVLHTDDRVLTDAIERARSGDTSALHYLYVRYADDVYGYVESIVRDAYEAEDITQNVFAKLMTAIRRYQSSAVPFSAWLLRVARNATLDHLRSNRSVPCEEIYAADDHDEQDRADRGHSLNDALSLLPED